MTDELLKYLDEIRELKQKLLPDPSKVYRYLRYDSWYKPHMSGGGDYFDVTELPGEDNHYGLIIADVSGHGPGAAVEVSMLDSILRTYPVDLHKGPAGALNYTNRHLFTRNYRGNFITAFILNYDGNRNRISFVNAGHPPPLIVHNDGKVEILRENLHIPLCIDQEYAFTNHHIESDGIERIVLYTDGITEIKSESGQELVIEGLREIVEEGKDVQSVKKRIIEFASETELTESDDITLLIADLLPQYNR